MNPKDLTKRIELAQYIASKANALIMGLYHIAPITEDKLTDGLITELNLSIQSMALNNIYALFKIDGFSSAKTAILKSSSGFEWIIDPLLGVNNFVRGLALCGSQLVISYNNELVYSLILHPFTQEWFTARKGAGAMYKNRQTGEETKLQVSRRDLPHAMAVFDSSVGKSNNLATKILGSLGDEIAAVKSFGMAVFDIIAVVSGVAEILISGITEKYYVAAGMLLNAEAGGEIYALKGRQTNMTDKFMVFNSKSLKEPLLRPIKRTI